MKFPFNLPELVAYHRFSQDSRYYDGANFRFHDLSPYNRFGSYVEKTAGTPSFSTHGTFGREGLKLDNSCQWQFVDPIPWEGTMLAVVKGHVPTAFQTLWLWLFGDAVAPSSNGALTLQTDGSSVISTQMASPASVLAAGNLTLTQDAITVFAYAMDQETRKGYRTLDFATISESAAAGAAANGNALSLGSSGNTGIAGTVGSRMVRLGNNSGTPGDTAANGTNFAYVFEQAFFRGNLLRTNPAALKEVADTLKTYYG